MINLADIGKWVQIADGEMIQFPGSRPRPVKLDVNTSGPAVMMIEEEGEEPRLLALVTGRETISMVVAGAYTIMHKSPDVDVYILTADGSKVHREQVGAETYTRLHERRAVDPELERMRYVMELNHQKRMAKQAAHFERVMNEINAKIDSGKSAGKPDPLPSERAAEPEAPGAQPEPAAGKGVGDAKP